MTRTDLIEEIIRLEIKMGITSEDEAFEARAGYNTLTIIDLSEMLESYQWLQHSENKNGRI